MLHSGHRERRMRATAIEFRLRVVIITFIITLGFWSPWIETLGMGRRISLLEWLALELSRMGLLRFSASISVVIVFASAVAALGAVLRVWGTAYMGTGTVNHREMKAGSVMANGPYRYMRNPLYLGSWCMIAAMSFIMSATGALFAMVLLTVFLWRLILGEEAFLAGRLGEPYQVYRRTVPRILPHLRLGTLIRSPQSSGKPLWLHSVLSELNPIGVFAILAGLSWSYDNRFMVRAVIVSFGLSLVVQALTPETRHEARLAE